jgi:hypothetical protein
MIGVHIRRVNHPQAQSLNQIAHLLIVKNIYINYQHKF